MTEMTNELSAEQAELLNLGDVLGQHRTLAAVAGKLSAAQAATLARIRNEKRYRICTPQWEEFCTRYLRVSRAEVDRTIRLWQEFGASYFELSQLTRVSPETYRAIQDSVKDGELHHHGEAIAMTPENADRIAAMVAEKRRALPPATKPARVRRTETASELVAALDRRCTRFAEELESLVEDAREEGCDRELSRVLDRWRCELGRIAARNAAA